MEEADYQLKDGDYVGFIFSADYTLGEALAVTVVKNMGLEDFWHPCDHFPYDTVDDKTDEYCLEFLEQHGIKTIWTPWDGESQIGRKFLESFMGRALRWHEDENNWGYYRPIENVYYASSMRSFGIELKFLSSIVL